LATFYIFWELVLIPMFFMIGKWGPEPEKARRAAIKFLIYTHVGAILMLLGFIYVYTQLGTFEMTEIAGGLGLTAQKIAMALVFFGFAFKLPVFPFHTWLPDAHVEAPSPASVLLAGLLLKMAGYGFVRSVWLFPMGIEAFKLVFLILAVVSVLYSASVAIMQEDMKKMIAYSSINHMGYVFLATTAAAVASIGTISPALNISTTSIFEYCMLGAIFVMFSHGVIIGILFLLAGIIHHSAGTREISKIEGLAHKMPWVAFLLLIGGIAAGGMPGMVGFVGELLVFVGSISGLFDPYWWVSFAIAGPLIVLAFMIWLNQRVFFGELQLRAKSDIENPSPWELLPLAILVIPIILFGIYPELLNTLMKEAVRAIAP
ncbi:MAG: NADH-quinone oxidoreductase subunit M, partial [Candidatus Korarchaeota archaeon]|nr:NADH-quinone oxidoreductase subunit M [Candidatus Korarchaeota archaeon]NIU83903.1 NADH-quinone oxidoreductase subunit M [Candidatus Thorarchaeota archaeon]NIW14046.1 NADH-quinone oxidoreductase subunit M [Candidatus Thorarchaeota archaeon]NIW51735.1 NADH-quinone oxidoreductase subunit M [Candidatus Korarchaeota archaeon]